jgi:hypothetical protein
VTFFRARIAPSYPAEDDAPLVDDEAGVPAALVETLADVVEALLQTAGRNVYADVSSRARFASVGAFER